MMVLETDWQGFADSINGVPKGVERYDGFQAEIIDVGQSRGTDYSSHNL